MVETPSKKTIDALNLASVQRIDPCAVSVIDRCTYASLYSYAKSEGWQKTEIEGPMLVYRRADRPTHSFIIANRHSRQDFIEPISPTLQLCLKSSYIMLKKPEEKEIYGIWICDTDDCERIFNLLNTLVSECARSPPPAKVSSESPNLLDLLSRPPETRELEKSPSPVKPSRKTTDEMPAMLAKLLCDERQLSKGNLPKGAMSADQIERQLLYDQAAKQKPVDFLKKEASEANITPNYSCASLGALSTTARRGSEGTLTIAPEEDLNSLVAGCSSTVASLKVELPEKEQQPVVEKELNGPTKMSPTPAIGLDKDQMLQALQHLLKTDDDFVARLHMAYVDSLNMRLGI